MTRALLVMLLVALSAPLAAQNEAISSFGQNHHRVRAWAVDTVVRNAWFLLPVVGGDLSDLPDDERQRRILLMADALAQYVLDGALDLGQ